MINGLMIFVIICSGLKFVVNCITWRFPKKFGELLIFMINELIQMYFVLQFIEDVNSMGEGDPKKLANSYDSKALKFKFFFINKLDCYNA